MNLQNTSKPADGKRQWRESLRAKLQHHCASTPVASQQQGQDQLRANLCDYLKNQSGTWAGFQALPQEPDLTSVYQQMTHLTWAFPRIESAHLHFHTCENFVTGSFGISEPSKDSPVVAGADLSGILVPGLGFDKKGRRLGRGRGYYDRALADYKGIKVGVGFSCQVVDDDLPADPHDVLMDALVTETEFRLL